MKKSLETLLEEFGIYLKDGGTYRHPADIIEDLYIRISPVDWKEIVLFKKIKTLRRLFLWLHP